MANNKGYFIFVTVGLLVCGTFNSLVAKIIYGLEAAGADRPIHRFTKPWFQCTNMFVGMMLCLPLYRMKMHFLRKKLQGKIKSEQAQKQEEGAPTAGDDDETDRLISDGDTSKQSSPFVVFLPAMADLVATGLMFSGLVFTTASVYQMLRGAQVVFCAILSTIFLKHHLDKFMWGGILLTVLGITCVGSASLLGAEQADGSETDQTQQLFGIGLILLSQMVQAVQMILEESLLQDIKMDALMLAGYEGLWGGLLCLGVALPLFQWLPGSDGGHLEDTVDSVHMLGNSSALVLAEVLNCLSVLTYNFFGLTVTQDFTAMHRVIIEASRSLLVWVSNLFIFYFVTDGKFGECWEWTSWIQLAGFCILLTGTMFYNYNNLFGSTDDVEKGATLKLSFAGSARSRASSSGLDRTPRV